MDLVVDANILFAALIKESATSDLLFVDQLRLFAPEFLFEEFSRYEEELLRKTRRSGEEFRRLMTTLERRILLVPEDEIRPFLKQAQSISPDPKDVAYIALALKLRCPVWSNDKRLANQGNVRVYSTDDVLQIVTGRNGG